MHYTSQHKHFLAILPFQKIDHEQYVCNGVFTRYHEHELGFMFVLQQRPGHLHGRERSNIEHAAREGDNN